MRSLRSALYLAARLLGDVQAVRKGPAAVGRRVVRRQAYRTGGRAVRAFLRALGL